MIDEDKSVIDVGGDSDDEIKNNLKVSLSGTNTEINGDKLSLLYNGTVVREFSLQRVTSIKTGSMLNRFIGVIVVISVVSVMLAHKKITSNHKM